MEIMACWQSIASNTYWNIWLGNGWMVIGPSAWRIWMLTGLQPYMAIHHGCIPVMNEIRGFVDSQQHVRGYQVPSQVRGKFRSCKGTVGNLLACFYFGGCAAALRNARAQALMGAPSVKNHSCRFTIKYGGVYHELDLPLLRLVGWWFWLVSNYIHVITNKNCKPSAVQLG